VRRDIRRQYARELHRQCGGGASGSGAATWKKFEEYADAKEQGKCAISHPGKAVRLLRTRGRTELWDIFQRLDFKHDMCLDMDELRTALEQAGV
jgi:hypothetical protein